MLANNTSISSVIFFNQLLKRTCDQFDRLRKRNAFLEQYKRESDNTLDDMDESKQVIQNLISEYIACESPDYLDYGNSIETIQDFRAPKSLTTFDPSYTLD